MTLTWQDVDALTDRYGESFYLFESHKFLKNYDDFLGAFQAYYPKVQIGYSYKTNYMPRICQIVNDRGGYAEVVSEMEFDLAIRVGVAPDRILVNGPYKPFDALERFLLSGSIVNLDSYHEVDYVVDIAARHPDAILQIGLRCNFPIDDELLSRFGFDASAERFRKVVDILRNVDNIALKGLHCHFPNRNLASYVERTDRILALSDALFDTPPAFIDIGGGFFGHMHQSLASQFSSRVPAYQEYAEVVGKRFADFFDAYPDNQKPFLFLEPGSALVADTMKFVSTVIETKMVRGRQLAMTSGSKFNVSLLSSTVNLPMTVLTQGVKTHSPESKFDVAGYTCIEGDYLYRGFSGMISPGDYLVFENVGSYSLVFKPPFILPNVSVIEWESGSDEYRIIKRQETVDDIFQTFVFAEKG